MNQVGLALQGGLQVLVVGLILGAGLPAIFALGIKSLAFGAGGDAEVDHARPHPVGRVLAALCFVVVVYAIVAGLEFIVGSGMNKTLSFTHIIPLLVDKS